MRNEISGVTWQRPISQPVLTGAKIVPLSGRRIQWRANILARRDRAAFRRSRPSRSSRPTPRATSGSLVIMILLIVLVIALRRSRFLTADRLGRSATIIADGIRTGHFYTDLWFSRAQRRTGTSRGRYIVAGICLMERETGRANLLWRSADRGSSRGTEMIA